MPEVPIADIAVLLDGTPETAGKAGWDGQEPEAEDLREYIDETSSPELLTKLAEAEAVDVQIGVFEFSLTDSNLFSIRGILVTKDGCRMSRSKPARTLNLLIENSEAGKTSPAAAAQLAQGEPVGTPQEMARLIETGQASKTAIITSPEGAEVYIDGNKAGVTPLEFVLIKRDNPRVLVIKLPGYEAVERELVPDGKNILIGTSLAKEP